MGVARWDERFSKTTRGRVIALLRRGPRTIDEVASLLGVTDNAIRAHVAALEKDRIVLQTGLRPSGGKPSYTYELAPEAERLFTKAYIPVLTQLVAALEERMTTAELESLLQDVGQRLARNAKLGRAAGNLRARVDAAAAALTDLGGIVDVETTESAVTLRGYSCPLADAVRQHPATCRAAERMVAEIVGQPVQESCDKGERPRCCFTIVKDAN